VKQLVCMQEPCSCRPLLLQHPMGLRQQCNFGETPGCCADNLLPHTCPADETEWTCGRTECNGRTVVRCEADGCNQCSTILYDKQDRVIPNNLCRVRLDDEITAMCANVQCPASAAESPCPPRPSCYPADWKLECIVDPCTCRAIWIDQDVRKKAECADQIRPVCVDQKDCPKDFACPSIDPNMAAQIGPDILAQLICVQEVCSCRPTLQLPSSLPPGFRLPCKGGECCADGQGPQYCNPAATNNICANVECSGMLVDECYSDPCNDCEIVLKNKRGVVIPNQQCRVPLDESIICPSVECPPEPDEGLQCGPPPAACPADWQLRCVRDPCVCSRRIWVDEDVRLASPACLQALAPPCVPQSACPAKFSCPGLPEGSPLCVQEKCTCRPVRAS
jgi:hypothetical protein